MPEYSGTDNLEAMAAATNYNSFLLGRILAQAPAAGKTLDFGAGLGTFAVQVRAHGVDVACLEPDRVLAEGLRAKGLVTFESMDSVAAASIDYVFSLDVLEHIENDGAAVLAIAGKLNSQGRLLLYVPAFQMLYSSMDHKVGHFRRYRRHQLQKIVAEAGFVDIKARYIDSIGFFASLAYRLMDNGTGSINVRMLKLYDRLLFPLSRLIDPLFGLFWGKNLILTASKP